MSHLLEDRPIAVETTTRPRPKNVTAPVRERSRVGSRQSGVHIETETVVVSRGRKWFVNLIGAVAFYLVVAGFFAGASNLLGNYMTKRAWGREIAAQKRFARIETASAATARRVAVRKAPTFLNGWAAERGMVRDTKVALVVTQDGTR